MGIIRTAAVAAVIIGVGLMHGAWTNRWGRSPEMAVLAARFDSVPMTIGDWTASPFEFGPRERKSAGAQACLARVYTNPVRGVTVSVLIVGGLPGKISTHTPEICYGASGYDLGTPAAFDRRYGPDGRRANFWTALATRNGANPDALRLFWSWHASTGWAAPREPRLTFASEPMLSKLYLVRKAGRAAVGPDRDPCNDFLDVLLPVLDRTVFRAPG